MVSCSNTKRHFYPNDVTATPIRFQSDIVGGVLSSAELFDITWARIPQNHNVSKNMPGSYFVCYCRQGIVASAKTDY